MLATIMNALAFEEALKSVGADVRPWYFPSERALETYIQKEPNIIWTKEIVILPEDRESVFTTDSLRLCGALNELRCVT